MWEHSHVAAAAGAQAPKATAGNGHQLCFLSPLTHKNKRESQFFHFQVSVFVSLNKTQV